MNKHMYKQHIQTKIESIEHVLRFTVSECNTNQHKLLNTKTCDMLWNDVERLLQNKFELETDLVLINETIPTNHFVLNQFIRNRLGDVNSIRVSFTMMPHMIICSVIRMGSRRGGGCWRFQSHLTLYFTFVCMFIIKKKANS